MLTVPWRALWGLISGRIDGLVQTGELFFRSIEKYTEDSYDVTGKILIPQADELYDKIVEYRSQYATELPASAVECLDQFFADFGSHFKSPPGSRDLSGRLQRVQIRLTALSAFRAQLEFCLASLEDQIRAATERAFMHLQRCILADNRYREQWKTAFEDGEPSCEKLGATHLLWHGIWAFKVDAAGGRTDLVMGNRIDNLVQIEKIALGIVLTEWKRATSDSDVEAKYVGVKSAVDCYSVK